MSISFKGYDTKYITVDNNNFNNGDLVSVNVTSNSFQKALDGANFIGKVVAVRDDLATVQEQGYVETKYIGADPTDTYAKLVSANNGNVKIDDVKAMNTYKIVKIDKENKIIGFLI